MLKAIIFDCDGVIVDSEPHHLKAFQIVLEEENIVLSNQDYYEKYLALDDKGLFEILLKSEGRPVDNAILKRLIVRKMPIYKALSEKTLFIYPGVVDFVQKAQGHYLLAVASGAFRGEIKFALAQGGLETAFPVIISAQDVRNGKPHPESFLKALDSLNTLQANNDPGAVPVEAAECVVIEDSLHGVAAARKAGMACLAVTSSYSREQLIPHASRVIDRLTEVVPKDLEALCPT